MHHTTWLSLCLILFCISQIACSTQRHTVNAVYTANPPNIDGHATEQMWAASTWQTIDQVIVGNAVETSDFSGRYKVLWNQQHLFLLVDIIDDKFVDAYSDPLDNYWNDDVLEVFIDADASGGDHQFNDNAYTYHIDHFGNVVDIGPFSSSDAKEPPNIQLYNNHIKSAWTRNEETKRITWELQISVYPQTEISANAEGPSSWTIHPAKPVSLEAGQILGWMLAYCDADGSGVRENLIGDKDIPTRDGTKNWGYIDADVFGRLVLQAPGF